jgi:hypothetical protein
MRHAAGGGAVWFACAASSRGFLAPRPLGVFRLSLRYQHESSAWASHGRGPKHYELPLA